MTCPHCTQAQTAGLCPLYVLTCLGCCTRLVLSTHPHKPAAAAMLAAIERMPGNPGRAAVLESVARCLGKPPSPGARSTSE
jgi:hypothetical protein